MLSFNFKSGNSTDFLNHKNLLYTLFTCHQTAAPAHIAGWTAWHQQRVFPEPARLRRPPRWHSCWWPAGRWPYVCSARRPACPGGGCSGAGARGICLKGQHRCRVSSKVLGSQEESLVWAPAGRHLLCRGRCGGHGSCEG